MPKGRLIIKRLIRTVIIFSLFSSIQNPLSHAAESQTPLEISLPTPITVSSSSNVVQIPISLPSSVTLGSSDVVKWSALEAYTFDSLGNKSQNLASPDSDAYGHDNIGINGLRIQFDGQGRRVNLILESRYAATYSIKVAATVSTNVFSKDFKVTFTPTSDRYSIAYTQDSAPKIEYQSPDVGRDLQTDIKVRVLFKSLWGSGLGGQVFVDNVRAYASDKNGKALLNGWFPANLYCTSDGRLCHNTTEWINFHVTYADWIKNGFNIYLAWTVATDKTNFEERQNMAFQRIIPVPINFPSPTPSLESSCDDVFIDKTSECRVRLVYKDAMGSSANGPSKAISWKLIDSNGLATSGEEPSLTAGSFFTVDIPKGKLAYKLLAQIPGTSISTESASSPHNYETDLVDSLSLTKSCPQSFKGTTFKCKISVSGSYPSPVTLTLSLQQKIDGKAWSTVKKVSLALNSSTTVTLPSSEKKSLSFRVITSYAGNNFYSDVQDWVVNSPTPKATTPSSSSSTKSATYNRAMSLMKQLDSSGNSPFTSYYINRNGGKYSYCVTLEKAGELDAGVTFTPKQTADFVKACTDFLTRKGF